MTSCPEKKVAFTWNQHILNDIIGLIYSLDNPNLKEITSETASNLYTLFTIRTDWERYEEISTVGSRIQFIIDSLDARINLHLNHRELMVAHAFPSEFAKDYDERFKIVDNIDGYMGKITDDTVKYLNKYVEDRLMYGFVIDYQKEFEELLDDIARGNIESYGEAGKTFKTLCERFLFDVNSICNDKKDTIDFNSADITTILNDVLEDLDTSLNALHTGFQSLDEMLQGGHRMGRLYTYLGISGGHKSALLLMISLYTVLFNAKTYVPKTEGFKPVVVYYTLENSLPETISRLFTMCYPDKNVEQYMSSEGKFDIEEIVRLLNESEIINNPLMELRIIYKNNETLRALDIDQELESLKAEGKECCLCVIDYLKRLLPNDPYCNDEKESLKNITNDLKTLAKKHLIPVVTAHQFNRMAVSKINQAIRAGEQNIGVALGAEYVGSAWEIVENSDVVVSLASETRKFDGVAYLSFNGLKSRNGWGKHRFFFQPFNSKSGLVVQPDYGIENLGIYNIADGLVSMDDGDDGEEKNKIAKRVVRSNKKQRTEEEMGKLNQYSMVKL